MVVLGVRIIEVVVAAGGDAGCPHDGAAPRASKTTAIAWIGATRDLDTGPTVAGPAWHVTHSSACLHDRGKIGFFHTMGRIATSQLMDLAGITSHTAVLDAGSGVGGTARYVADRYGCTVTAVDLTEEFCDTARWLNHLVGLDDRITVRTADVIALPFSGGTFQAVVSQHVQMNVADDCAPSRAWHGRSVDSGSTGETAVAQRKWEYTERMSFDPRFARNTILPMAQAAYAVFQTPGAEPALPVSYRKTGLLVADTNVLTALGDLPDSASTLVEAVVAPGAVFGLLGNNPDPAVKTAFVSFRGTLTPAEWMDNLDFSTTPYRPVANFGQVHMGWMTLYETIRPSLMSNLAAACAGCDQLLVTGHSLGAALAVLAAPDILRNMPPNLEPKVTTFAGPRAGLHNFAAAFNMTIESCFRVVNQYDIVPHLPLAFPWLPYEHVGVEVAVDSGGPTDQVYRHSLAAYSAGLASLEVAPASAV